MMPKTWTDVEIRVGDKLQERHTDSECNIIRALAADALNNTDSWTEAESDLLRCAFLAADGHAIRVELGIATIESSLAAVSSIHVFGAGLSGLILPLKRSDEFESDFVDADYQSKPRSGKNTARFRVGEVRPMQPMKFGDDD